MLFTIKQFYRSSPSGRLSIALDLIDGWINARSMHALFSSFIFSAKFVLMLYLRQISSTEFWTIFLLYWTTAQFLENFENEKNENDTFLRFRLLFYLTKATLPNSLPLLHGFVCVHWLHKNFWNSIWKPKMLFIRFFKI